MRKLCPDLRKLVPVLWIVLAFMIAWCSALGLVACSGHRDTSSPTVGEVAIAIQAAPEATRAEIDVRKDPSQELVLSQSLLASSAKGGQFTARLSLPPGSYSLRVVAGNSEEDLFEGHANASVTSGQRTTLVIYLVPKRAATASDTAPVIDSIALSPGATVPPGGTLSISALAHDSEGEALTYSWQGEGVFRTPTSTSTTWEAPMAPGRVVITLAVSDGHGTTIAEVDVEVSESSGQPGSVDVTTRIDHSPSVFLTVTGVPAIGEDIKVAVRVIDEDPGDVVNRPLTLEVRDCEGNLTAEEEDTWSFVIVGPAGATQCVFALTAIDSHGASATASRTIQLGGPVLRVPPEIVSAIQTPIRAVAPGDAVRMTVVAFDPLDAERAVTGLWSTLPALGEFTNITSHVEGGLTTLEATWIAPAVCSIGSSVQGEIGLRLQVSGTGGERTQTGDVVIDCSTVGAGEATDAGSGSNTGADSGVPQVVSTFPEKLTTCRTISLRPEMTFDPPANTDANVTLNPAMTFAIPADFVVEEGNAGNGALSFAFEQASGGTVTCAYSGSALDDGAEAPGARYLLRSCSGGETAGQRVAATVVSLHIENGNHLSPAGRVLVSATLNEFEPCAGNAALIVNPSTTDSLLASLRSSDGTQIDGFGHHPSGDMNGSLELVQGVSGQGEQVTVELNQGNISRIWGEHGVTISIEETSEGKRVTVEGSSVGNYVVTVPPLDGGATGSPKLAAKPVASGLQSLTDATAEPQAPIALYAPPTASTPETPSMLFAPPAMGMGQSLVEVNWCGTPSDDALVQMQIMTRSGFIVTSTADHVGPGQYVMLAPTFTPGDTLASICATTVKAIVISCDILGKTPTLFDGSFCASIAGFAGPGAPEVFGACVSGFLTARSYCKLAPAWEDPTTFVCDELGDKLNRAVDIYPIGLAPKVRFPGVNRLYYATDPRFISVQSQSSPFPNFEVDAGENCTTSQPQPCTVSLSTSGLSIPPQGGSQSVNLTTSDGCSWSAIADVPWIQLLTPSGAGSGPLRMTVAANTSSQTRFGHVSIGSNLLVVTQGGASGCSFQVSPATLSFAASGGTGQIDVVASNNTCSWGARSESSWVTITQGASGTASGRVQFSVLPNTASQSRLARLTVAGQSVVITQTTNGTPPPPPSPDPQCPVTLSPTTASFPNQGGMGSFSVNAPDGCRWEPRSTDSWIFIGSDPGQGRGSVSYSVGIQTLGSRTGTITVGNATFTVQQSSPTLECRYGLDHLNKTFGPAGGNDSIEVVSNFALCPWEARVDPPVNWLSMAVPTKGVAQGKVVYSVDANRSEQARQTNIVFMNVLFHVQQDGLAPCTFSVAPTTTTVPASGGTASVQVSTSRTDCQWNVSLAEPDQVQVSGSTAGVGSRTVDLVVMANPNTTSRELHATIAGTPVVVSQSGAPMITRQVNVSVQGPGTLTSSSGDTCTSTCAWTLPVGSQIAITAAAGSTGAFQSWGGDCAGASASWCTITMNTNRNVSVVFSSTVPPPSPKLTVSVGGVGAVLVYGTAARVWVQMGESIEFPSLSPGKAVQLAALGRLSAGYSGCPNAGTSPFCSLIPNGNQSVSVDFTTAGNLPQVNGTVRTMQFGTARVGQTVDIMERWNPPCGGNLRLSFVSPQERADFIRLADAAIPAALGPWSLPYGDYFPCPGNGQNILFRMSAKPGSVTVATDLATPLYWYYEAAPATVNLLVLSGRLVP